VTMDLQTTLFNLIIPQRTTKISNAWVLMVVKLRMYLQMMDEIRLLLLIPMHMIFQWARDSLCRLRIGEKLPILLRMGPGLFLRCLKTALLRFLILDARVNPNN
jgi:hypothetical protein